MNIPPTGGGGGVDPVRTIQIHYQRQATPEVWAEVDELRTRVAKLEAALTRALTDVGCIDEEKCPHWVEWHNMAREALAEQ